MAIALGLVLARGSSGGDGEDPARAALVDAAGLTDDVATCILDDAADRYIDVGILRQMILDPGSDATLSQADQRAVNEVAAACLAG